MTISENVRFDWKVTAFIAACAVSWGVIYTKVEYLSKAVEPIPQMAISAAKTQEDVAYIKSRLRPESVSVSKP